MQETTTSPDRLKCLSIKQPWALLIGSGARSIENRKHTTPFRGTIAIHAGPSRGVVNDLKKATARESLPAEPFAYGAIIGFADLVDVHCYGPGDEQNAEASGPYCWHFTNARLLEQPVRAAGKQKLFPLPEKLSEQLRSASLSTSSETIEPLAVELAHLVTPSPDPLANYLNTIDELDGKIPDEQLFALAARMIELAPEARQGYFARLQLCNTTGATEFAESDIEVVLERFRDDMAILAAAAETCLLLEKFELANELLTDVLTDNPSDTTSRCFRGLARFSLEELDGALADFEVVVGTEEDLTEDHFLSYLMLARIHQCRDELDEAEEFISVALEIDPENSEACAVAAQIAEDRGDDAAAKHWALMAEQYGGDDVDGEGDDDHHHHDDEDDAEDASDHDHSH